MESPKATEPVCINKVHPAIAMNIGTKFVELGISESFWSKLTDAERDEIHYKFRDIAESTCFQMENALAYTIGSVRLRKLNDVIK